MAVHRQMLLLIKEIRFINPSVRRMALKREKMKQISYAFAFESLNILERFQSNDWMDYYRAAKQVMKYLQRTKNFIFVYSNCMNWIIVGFADSDSVIALMTWNLRLAMCLNSLVERFRRRMLNKLLLRRHHACWRYNLGSMAEEFYFWLNIVDSISKTYSDVLWWWLICVLF